MGRYSKNTTLSARFADWELAQVDRLAEVGFGRARYLSSRTRPSRSDVIREAVKFAEETLAERDTVQGKELAKLIAKAKKQ